MCAVALSGTLTLGGDLEVHRLGFGAMRITGDGIWGPPADRETALAVLRRAVELGVDLIDTADSYGPHVSEQLIAEALHPYRDGLVIATKGGLERTGPGRWPANGRPEHLREACERSLRDLRVDRIDLYQLHRPDPHVPYAESIGALKELQDEGKIRHVGVSNVTIGQLREARSIVDVVSVQNRFNVGDRSSADVLAYCERHRLGFFPCARRDAGPGHPRLAAGALAGHAADSRDGLARAPRGEPRGGRAAVDRRRARAARAGRVAVRPAAPAARPARTPAAGT
jgi:pyridoxine 4-dehydrogenase